MSPPASQLLARFTPPARRNVVFSIKQTGVPLGGILAAAIMPAIAVWLGWQWALAGTAAVLGIQAIIMQRWRAAWDDDRDPSVGLASHPFTGIAIVWRRGALRLLSLSGGCFVVVQVCLQTFTVVLFVEQIGIDIITAGTSMGSQAAVIALGNGDGSFGSASQPLVNIAVGPTPRAIAIGVRAAATDDERAPGVRPSQRPQLGPRACQQVQVLTARPEHARE